MSIIGKQRLTKNRFSNRKLEVKVIERGIILPPRKKEVGFAGGVCDNDFNFVAGYTRKDPTNGTGGSWLHTDSAYTVERDTLIQLDEDVIFGGVLYKHFGHFMMECLNRLWFVLQNPKIKSKILFVSIANIYPSWFEDFFRLMGIEKERIVYVKQPTQCRSVTVPDQSQYWESYTKEWFLPFQAIKSYVTPGESKNCT